MRDAIFAHKGSRRYRVTFTTIAEYFADAIDDNGSPFDTLRMRGVAWTLWLEIADPDDAGWFGDCICSGIAPTRRVAVGRAKTAVGL